MVLRMFKIFLSEMVKLVTIRAVWLTFALTVLLTIAVAALNAPSLRRLLVANDPMLAPGVTPESVGLEMIGLGMIGAIVIGVLAGSNEYTGGQIKTSLLAVPNRLTLALTKSFALLVVVTVMGVTAIPALSLVSQHGLGELSVIQSGIPVSLIHSWVGGVFVWIATAQIAFAVAMLMKQSFVPLSVLIVISQTTLVIVHLLPISRFLPFAAGVYLYDPAMITGSTPAATLSTIAAVVTLCGWTVALLVWAAVVFYRRDAAA